MHLLVTAWALVILAKLGAMEGKMGWSAFFLVLAVLNYIGFLFSKEK